MKKILVPALLLFALALTSPAAAIEKGAAAPDFTVESLAGETVHLSDFKGRPIILKLATTWCPTCKQQSQAIKEVEDLIRSENVAVIEVFLQDSRKMIDEYYQKGDFSVPHVALVDDGSALRAYNVYLIPRTLIIDQDFKVRRDGSLIEAEDLRSALEKILDGQE